MVALLAEGVDRNNPAGTLYGWRGDVALLAEGVDRNCCVWVWTHERPPSPSSRRAWIEIIASHKPSTSFTQSPSSRRAWIEIHFINNRRRVLWVALLAEGVDRNITWDTSTNILHRSPSSRRAWIEIQLVKVIKKATRWSPSSRRAWIEIPYGICSSSYVRSPSSRRAWIEILASSSILVAHWSPSSRRAWIEI